MKEHRVKISTHNPTMRTALRMVALTSPFWALLVIGQFLGVLGFFLSPVIYDSFGRIVVMLLEFLTGAGLTALLLSNSLVLRKKHIDFPPLKAARVSSEKIERIAWHWDSFEKEAYLRFFIGNSDFVDIHTSRLSSKKLALLKDALREWSPQCVVEVFADDLEDPIAFRERFCRPRLLSLSEAEGRKRSQAIDIPYQPHKELDEFFRSLGANEKYFWYCWFTVLTVPCLEAVPDMVWSVIADLRHVERWVDVPALVTAIDQLRDLQNLLLFGGLSAAGHVFYSATTNVFGLCILLCVAGLAVVALMMFIFQPNGITLKPEGLEVFFHYRKFTILKSLYAWKDMVSFDLDQFGDVVNPEKWRMQIKMVDGSTVNLKIESIKGAEARETLLRTISQMAPNAVQDAALIRALMPSQKESYTELWLESLAAPPKRNRLAPLGEGQKLRAGRFLVEKKLAVGGQGVAYLAQDLCAPDAAFGKSNRMKEVVLKEFVLPVYTSRAVRRQALERFENEARILRDLDSPQIVKLIDYFLEDHRAYLVLERIDGLSLRKLVQSEGAMRLDQILDLSRQMCSMLEYLHSLSPAVVHRDFTPDNLILDKNGRLVLIDFNVAQQKQWTTTGTVVGKHAYLPPEQFRGQPTTQSDLYAMGATLFFLITGQDPEPITCSHPVRVNDSISADLDDIVARLTAVELTDRYSVIADVRRDLEALPQAAADIAETSAAAGSSLPIAADQSDVAAVEVGEETESEPVIVLTPERVKEKVSATKVFASHG